MIILSCLKIAYFACDEKLNPQDIVDILIMINDLKKEQYKRLN